METNVTIPICYMCRLCLNYSEDCIEMNENDIRHQIKKYLQVEITDNDNLPKTVCQPCIERVRSFDQFYMEVIQNQHLLKQSKSKKAFNEMQIVAGPTSLIQLSPGIVSKANGTFIITLKTNTDSHRINEVHDQQQQIRTEMLSIERVDNYTSKSDQMHSIKIERELDDLANDDITIDVNGESDNEDVDMENEQIVDNNSTAANHNVQQKVYENFPSKLIEDGKLLYKGRELLNMITKFYRLECDQCRDDPERLVFASLSELCQHYIDCHQMKGYVVCCNTKLIKPRAIALHMARHLQPSAFTCEECNKVLTCPKILQYHLQNHRPESERPLACPQCPRRFSYSSALIAHSISHQPEDQRAAHVCDECGKVFASAGRLATHINVSHMQQNYVCHICSKKFACRTNLTYHLTTHQPNTKRVQCSKCDKWLKNKLCLRKHMVQHSSVRFTCIMCNYSTLNRQCLQNHMRVQHTNDKPFSCDVCGKSFKLKNTLVNHSAQHTGVRKFVCPFCNRTFASSGNFYSHRKRMHPQELAAMKQKQDEDERLMREQSLKSGDLS